MTSMRFSSVTIKIDEAQATGRHDDMLLSSWPMRRMLLFPEDEVVLDPAWAWKA